LHFYQERHRKLEVKDVKGINPGKMVIFWHLFYCVIWSVGGGGPLVKN
jgi:hypothetical protein